jgi:molybdopterin converting factor small subunit
VKVTVLLFARARDTAGTGRLDLDVDDASSPEAVFRVVSDRAPGLAGLRPNLRVAIDQEYAGWDDRLHDGAELAFISPTSGG